MTFYYQTHYFFPTENEIFEIDNVTPSTVPNLTPHQKTGVKSVDDKNYEDYLKILQIYRPDLFIDEEDNNNNTVIPTTKIEDVAPPDIFTPKTEFVPDSTPPQKTGIKSVDDKNYEDYLKAFQIYRPDLFIDEEDNYVISTPKTEIIEIEDVVFQHQQKQYPLFPKKLLNYQKQYPKLICLKTLTIFQQFLILMKLLVQISLIMSMETLTLTLLNKHLTITMT